jgi:glycogen(starch) synthase
LSDPKEAAGLRILVISNMYPPHHLGGYELSCRDVIGRWRSKGHQVEILTSDLRLESATEADEQDRGVRRVLRLYWRDFEILRPPIRERLAIERWNQGKLREAIAEFKPDVISGWHMGALSLGMLTTVGDLGIPLILVMQDDWLIYGPNIDGWLHLFKRLPGIRRVARTLTGVPTTFRPPPSTTACYISEANRRRAQKEAHWLPARSAITNNGVDPVDFPLRDPAVRDWNWRLLYVGRIEERKGVAVAVESLSSLPAQATLRIVGPPDAAFVSQLSSRIEQLGLKDRVVFDNSARSRLHEVYSEADVLLFPVLWDEPFGIVPLEAMACATPVIATGTGGSGEFLIDEANCLLVEPGDAGGLADAVRRVTDESLRRRLIEGGRLTAQNLNVDEYALVLESWHVAAAAGYSHGEPETRVPLDELLAPLRSRGS